MPGMEVNMCGEQWISIERFVELLLEQAKHMGGYLSVLRRRAEIEDVKL